MKIYRKYNDMYSKSIEINENIKKIIENQNNLKNIIEKTIGNQWKLKNPPGIQEFQRMKTKKHYI